MPLCCLLCAARSYLEDLREAAAGQGDDEDGELEGDEAAAAAAAAGDAELAEKLRLDALEVCCTRCCPVELDPTVHDD